MLSLVLHNTNCELWRVTSRHCFKALVGIYGTKNKEIERQIVLKFIRNRATHKPIQRVKIGSGKSFSAFQLSVAQRCFNVGH